MISNRFWQLCRQFSHLRHDHAGATAIEYSLIALVALVIIGALTVVGDQVSALFDTVSDAFGN